MGTVCSRQNQRNTTNTAAAAAAADGHAAAVPAAAAARATGPEGGREGAGTLGALQMLLGGSPGAGSGAGSAAARDAEVCARAAEFKKANTYCACGNYFCVNNFDPRLVNTMFAAQRARIRKQREEGRQPPGRERRSRVGGETARALEALDGDRARGDAEEEDRDEEEEARMFQHRPKTLIQLCVESIADGIVVGDIDNVTMLPQVRAALPAPHPAASGGGAGARRRRGNAAAPEEFLNSDARPAAPARAHRTSRSRSSTTSWRTTG